VTSRPGTAPHLRELTLLRRVRDRMDREYDHSLELPPARRPDASLAFYRDTLGFEVRNDVGYNGMRWITVGPVGQPGTSIVLHPPAATPGLAADERRTAAEMMATGTYGMVILATRDLDATFGRLQASGADVIQEATAQPYGVRDCAFRDPAGNHIRINEVR
jgi:predicted enzyme related to lactoylglutathione lyase